MRWPFGTPRAPQREPSEEELDELGRALAQAADAAPMSPRAEAIRTRLLDSLDERQPRFALVPAMVVAVLVAVIGVGAAVGTQSIGSLIPPPVRTFLDDLLGPELTPPLLPPADDEYAGPDSPDTPGDDAPGHVDPPDEAGPPQRPVPPTPVPAGPPVTTPTPAAGEGPPNWVPVRGPPGPPPVVTPPPRPTPPQTGPPGDAGP